MTYAELIENINNYIKENGNNEITGEVLNVVLNYIADYFKGVIGDETTLSTPNTDDLVKAINSVNSALGNVTTGYVRLFTGTENPNDTPPLNYKNGDFYVETNISNVPLALWQYRIDGWYNTKPDEIITLVSKGFLDGVRNSQQGKLQLGDIGQGVDTDGHYFMGVWTSGVDSQEAANYYKLIEHNYAPVTS